MKMQSIVVATDFSETSQAALELGTTLALDMGARLLIVHVESPEVMYGGEELDLLMQPVESPVAMRLLEQVFPTDPNVPCEHHLLTGSASDEIVRFAAEHHADLIVVGTHGRSGPLRLLLGSVAQSVVRHAPCPVLTVKSSYLSKPAKEEQ